MEVAILTVGDEVLAGDTTNTNAAWLAGELTDRGITVARILTLPDDRDGIAETVEDWRSRFDAVIVTGGLGGTHDDVTADAIADVFEVDLEVTDAVREDVIRSIADYRDVDPDVVRESEIQLDVDAWAALPEGSRALLNPAGLCPGFVLENVYAFPGIPDEMQALFGQVAAEFDGDTVSQNVYTTWPEANLIEPIGNLRERFDVTVGSYPDTRANNRLKVSGRDPDAVAAAADWLRSEIEVAAGPEREDDGGSDSG